MSKKRKPAQPKPQSVTDPSPVPSQITNPSVIEPKPDGTELLAKATNRAKTTIAQNTIPAKSQLSRYVSFGLLLGIIALVGFIFYEVMANFLVSLFLAALLVVVFRPLHKWFLEKVGGREKIAALLTTTSILLLVLIPIVALFLLAAAEAREVITQFNSTKVVEGVRKVRSNLRLDMPAASLLRQIDSQLSDLQQTVVLSDVEVDKHRSSLYEIEETAHAIATQLNQTWPVKNPAANSILNSGSDLELQSETDSQVEAESQKGDSVVNPNDNWKLFVNGLAQARQLHRKTWLTRSSNESEAEETERLEKTREYKQLISDTVMHFSKFKANFLGGKAKVWLIELVNPSDQEIESYTAKAVNFLREKLLRFGSGAAAVVGNTILSFAIMMIGLYFFLLDGPNMIETFKRLSPIDDQHEQQLVAEFGKVSRAVVVATLLSALVQGILAGIGFYFARLDSIFLLTVLSAVLAMIPFVGAAAVWVPCCLYLYFFDNNMTAAIGLAVYGTLIISMADNVIKPMVLHGQSNLHPLLALLSVLGGVATLGPIGILVGPMVVAFLQTLLKILRSEITEFEMEENQSLASSSERQL